MARATAESAPRFPANAQMRSFLNCWHYSARTSATAVKRSFAESAETPRGGWRLQWRIHSPVARFPSIAAGF